MSLASIIGLGYSGYAIINGVPILLLPSGTPEDEHLILSEGAFNPDPAKNTNQLVALQKRSFKISFQTNVAPKTWPLLKALTYGWRSIDQMDSVPEVPFTYVIGTEEGFEGTGYVDDVTLSAGPDKFLTMAINFTAWNWTELAGNPLTRLGTPVLGSLGPLLDPGYKPIAGWNCPVVTSVVSSDAILQQYSLKCANNWVYQMMMEGYTQPPNPGLISAGQLDVNLDISWVAARNDRPKNSGSFKFYIGGNDSTNPPLDIIDISYMNRGGKSYDGGGGPNQMVNWQANYFCVGPVPTSNL